jgi:hypothetical protein
MPKGAATFHTATVIDVQQPLFFDGVPEGDTSTVN